MGIEVGEMKVNGFSTVALTALNQVKFQGEHREHSWVW